MTPSRDSEKSAAEYGREALSQWREAARFGAQALMERKREKAEKSAREEVAAEAGSGLTSELGDLADAALAKFGKSGKLAAKVGVGSRLVKHIAPGNGDAGSDEEADQEDAPEEEIAADGADADSDEDADSGEDADSDEGAASDEDAHLFDDAAPIPIQESIDIAVPVAAVFDLCTRFEELPRFSERIRGVAVEDDRYLVLRLKLGGREQELELTILVVEPEERIDWEADEPVSHAGVVSFHPLAPRLTRVELTIEHESEGLLERLLRAAGIPERAIRHELRRFKAYAELWDEANDYKSADFKDPASEQADDEPQGEADETDEPEAEAEPEPDEEPEAEDEAEEPAEDEEEELEAAP